MSQHSDAKLKQVDGILAGWMRLNSGRLLAQRAEWNSPSGAVTLLEDGQIKVEHTFCHQDAESVKEEIDEAVEAAFALEQKEPA